MDTNPSLAKAVKIAEPVNVSPMSRPIGLAEDIGNDPSPQNQKQHRASIARRLSGRPSYNASSSSIASQSSAASAAQPGLANPETNTAKPDERQNRNYTDHDASSKLVSQVLGWLHEEKEKRSQRRQSKTHYSDHHPVESSPLVNHKVEHIENKGHHRRRSSELSDTGIALEKLEQILAENMVIDRNSLKTPTKDRRGSYFPRRSSSNRNFRKGSAVASSDTDYADGDAIVPSAEVVLDNSKTMSYSGGAADMDADLSTSKKRASKEKEAWVVFKSQVVRLTHTLRLKGWRRVPLDRGGDIEVERLSGALTNAVYVVSPPQDLPQTPRNDSSMSLVPQKPPPKLLLRIYGPQVEHLIDRENELQILRRLARKKIGPRLLGTFLNGRFEEFFYARTLTAPDLRVPETSKQIAKRMRELHDGIELLEEERDAGPFVWRNWDKWVTHCEEVISWLDDQILSGKQGLIKSGSDQWKKRGLVCGVEWSVFRKTVEKYREWLEEQYGGTANVRKQLVFAHNDTQYGNLLRLTPSGESPLLLPANEHKQLIVIDFEYASANVPGLEFANHFTEWCYNYHDPTASYACNTAAYPTPTEQHRFLKAYTQHRPQFHPRASATPSTAASPGPSTSISAFMLDSRAGAPSTPSSYAEEEKQRDEEAEREIQRLMHEARLWRVANSAQWVAWGIVQAKVEGMDEALAAAHNPTFTALSASSSPSLSPVPSTSELPEADKPPHEHETDDRDDAEEEFDYLGYAQERAMFFWGDVLGLGVVKKEELPRELVERVKSVGY